MTDYQRRRAPPTEEGWYALHDLRRIDWDAWRGASERRRERALSEGVEYLRAHEDLADADEGASACFSVLGHGADLLVVHLRPTTAALDRAERRFEGTEFAAFAERADSYLSVTEVSGYVTEELADGIESIESEGTRNYLRQRLHPSIPDAEHVCFYPMDKRRGPGDNWYDLPFETRAELMEGHGEIGREYAGEVSQIITSSVGFDDHEWGVTLFADDATRIKDLLYEMRFDPSSSRFAEFGRFYVGRRFPPEDLPALLAGEQIPSGGDDTREAGDAGRGADSDERVDGVGGGDEGDEGGGTDDEGAERSGGRPPIGGDAPHEPVSGAALVEELRRLGVDPGEQPGAGHGVVVRSSADPAAVREEVDGLRGNFDHYDTHVATTVVPDDDGTAVVSLWRNERAATTASGFLFDLPGAREGIGGPLDGGENDRSRAGDAESDDTEGDNAESDGASDVRSELAAAGVYAGRPHGEDVHAVVVYSTAGAEELHAAAARLRDRFVEYDTHLKTATYAAGDGLSVGEGGPAPRAVVSLWETADAADTAGEYLSDLPGVVARAGGNGDDGNDGNDGDGAGFGTMGMFYTVKPDHREAFLDRFGAVGDLLGDLEGHRGTALLVNHEDENDTFIASRWTSREDAVAFFRSEDFRETVEWGREVLADRPRHVFLA